MSDHSTTEETSAEPLFTPSEVQQFTEDDAEAGRAIGKMLSSLFLYTVVAMTVSVLATYYWVTTSSLN